MSSPSPTRPKIPSPSGIGRRPCSSCKAKISRKDRHSLCFLCLGISHYQGDEASCKACLSLPREERERRIAYASPAVAQPSSSQEEEFEVGYVPLDLPPAPRDWGDCVVENERDEDQGSFIKEESCANAN